MEHAGWIGNHWKKPELAITTLWLVDFRDNGMGVLVDFRDNGVSLFARRALHLLRGVLLDFRENGMGVCLNMVMAVTSKTTMTMVMRMMMTMVMTTVMTTVVMMTMMTTFVMMVMTMYLKPKHCIRSNYVCGYRDGMMLYCLYSNTAHII